nr:hypothetical protein [Tanacetum cinerariifolium]
MKDTVAQTRSERVSKISNDPLLTGVNTPRSGEDSWKLNELMELCTKLQQRVLDLETTKTTQALEIYIMKKENIYLVNVHTDEEMLDVDQDLDGEEVFVAQQDENVVKKEVDAAQVQVTTAVTTPTILIYDVTLAQALVELKYTKPKAKSIGIVFHEPEESTTTTTAIPKSKLQDKGKDKMIKGSMKLKKKDQIQLDEEVALKLQSELQAEFEKEQRLANKKAQQEEEAKIVLIESWDDVQAKVMQIINWQKECKQKNNKS